MCRVVYMTTQRYKIEAWLGENHGLADDQVSDLIRIADEIAADLAQASEGERRAALMAAYQILLGGQGVVGGAARDLAQARADESAALAALRQAALMLIPAGDDTEAGFARRAGLDRMTIRNWLGKR